MKKVNEFISTNITHTQSCLPSRAVPHFLTMFLDCGIFSNILHHIKTIYYPSLVSMSNMKFSRSSLLIFLMIPLVQGVVSRIK